jgi:hypothetical protein
MDSETIFLPIHILGLLYAGWNIVHADHMGFDWMRGKVPTLDKKAVAKYHLGSWIGLGTMLISGFGLFYPMREFLLTRPQFFVKMGFVLALTINGLAIGHLSKISTEKAFVSLSTTQKIPLFISGAVSTISWIGATIMAFLLIPE